MESATCENSEMVCVDGLEDGRGDVLLARALVQKRRTSVFANTPQREAMG